MRRSWIVGTAQGRTAGHRGSGASGPIFAASASTFPLVRPVFEDFVAGHKLSDRVVFKGGDFFVDNVAENGRDRDGGHILHDWDLGQKKALLGKAFEALPERRGGHRLRSDSRR